MCVCIVCIVGVCLSICVYAPFLAQIQIIEYTVLLWLIWSDLHMPRQKPHMPNLKSFKERQQRRFRDAINDIITRHHHHLRQNDD
jgi:hypothetical protein